MSWPAGKLLGGSGRSPARVTRSGSGGPPTAGRCRRSSPSLPLRAWWTWRRPALPAPQRPRLAHADAGERWAHRTARSSSSPEDPRASARASSTGYRRSGVGGRRHSADDRAGGGPRPAHGRRGPVGSRHGGPDRRVRRWTTFGRIDTLVNNAGVYLSKPFIDYTADDFAAVIGVNLTGFFRLTQLAVTDMLSRGSGHVVNITTTLVDVADSTAPSVLTSLTKGGIAAATRSLAIEYGSRGIRVNAVSPGIIQTPDHPPQSYAASGNAARPARACRPGQRHRRRHALPGVVALRHRRDRARRRRPDRRPLRRRHRPCVQFSGATGGSMSS